MRELTRSVASFSWALSLFGVEQVANLISPRRATEAFGTVARAAEETLGPGLRLAFQAGDRMQKAVVDVSFRLAGQGSAPSGSNSSTSPDLLSQAGNLAFELLQLGVTTVYNVTGAAWQQQQGLPGWGPVPQADRQP
ncbi:MAG TPA: hypothetical protein VLX28_16945 [Thermoanaerobaculia bacterium]|nr:hypothetical protein [Thermoanaerobaculia bacterium]